MELASKTTFDNFPLQVDWSRTIIGEKSIEAPLVNPVNGFVSIYDNFQSRIIIAKGKPEAFRIVSLEASFDYTNEMFENIIEEQRDQSTVRWMIMDGDLRSLEVNSYRTISDPKANIPVDCVTVSYFERTCYYDGAILIYCTDWDPVSSHNVCNGESGGGGGGSSNYEEDIVIKDSSFVGTKADCIFEDLLESSDGFKGMIKKFDSSFSVSNIQFSLSSTLPSTTNGETSILSPGLVGISLNQNTLGGRTNLGVARTLIHETIHAEMYRKVLSMGGQVSIDDFPGIYDYYMRYEKNWQHEQMAAHYVEVIGKMLQEFDNYSNNYQYYEDFAWVGLYYFQDNNTGSGNYTYSQAWNDLEDAEQTRIMNVMQNGETNGNKNCD